MAWIAVDKKGHLIRWPWRWVKVHVRRHKKPKPAPAPQPVVEQTKPVVMFDDVNLALIPKDAPAVGGYVGGHWPTYQDGRILKGWPNAYHVAFAVAASLDADALDIERGDATPEQAAAWVKRQLARLPHLNTRLPVVYINAAGLQALVDLLAKSKLYHGKHYLIGSAHYTGHQHYCSPKCGFGIKVTADATQWTDKALGRSLDEWIVAPRFFKPKSIAV